MKDPAETVTEEPAPGAAAGPSGGSGGDKVQREAVSSSVSWVGAGPEEARAPDRDGAAPLTLKFGVSHQSLPGCELQPHKACCPDTAQSAPDPEFLLGCHLPSVVSRTMAPKEVHTPRPEPCTPTSPPGAKETADGSKSRI